MLAPSWEELGLQRGPEGRPVRSEFPDFANFAITGIRDIFESIGLDKCCNSVLSKLGFDLWIAVS